MREIKFRAKSGTQWRYGDLIHDSCNGHELIFIDDNAERTRHSVDKNTVGQFTGLRDADGREIYEGDVIRSVMLPHMRTTVCNGCVEYRNGAFYVEYIDHTYANLGDLIFYSGTSSAVIGNVHDNSDLLEVEHDRRD